MLKTDQPQTYIFSTTNKRLFNKITTARMGQHCTVFYDINDNVVIVYDENNDFDFHLQTV